METLDEKMHTILQQVYSKYANLIAYIEFNIFDHTIVFWTASNKNEEIIKFFNDLAKGTEHGYKVIFK